MKKLFLFLVFCVFNAHTSMAQDYRINLVVNGSAGSTGYMLAETLLPSIRQTGEEAMILSKPGAGGIIAVDFARKEKSYKNLLVVGGGIAKYESVLNKDFQPLVEDFQFVGPVLSTAFFLATNDPFVKTAKDIFNNNKIYTVASPNPITKSIIKELNSTYPNKFIEVPYKDSNQAWIDFLGGHVDLSVERATWFSGKSTTKINIIGNTTQKQFDRYPSLREFVPGLDISDNAIGVMIKRDAPENFTNKIESILCSYYNSTIVRNKLIDDGYAIIENTNRSHNAQLAKEIKELSTKKNLY